MGVYVKYDHREKKDVDAPLGKKNRAEKPAGRAGVVWGGNAKKGKDVSVINLNRNRLSRKKGNDVLAL